MNVEFTLYKGFLIADYQEDNIKAYRSRAYYASNTTSYESTGSPANIKLMIDDVGDHGDFTEAEYSVVMQLLGRTGINVCDLEAPEQAVHQWGTESHVDPKHKMEIEVNPRAVFTDVADWTRDHKIELENAIKDSIKGLRFPGWVDVKIMY